MELKKLYGVYEKAAELKQKLTHPYCAAVIVAAGSAAAMQPGSVPPQRTDFRALLPRIRLVRLR